MHAVVVAAALIEPPARGVDGARRVDGLDGLGRLGGVELPPSLVEQGPGDDAGVTLQAPHRRTGKSLPLVAVQRVVRREVPLVLLGIVTVVGPEPLEGRGDAARNPYVRVLPTAHHVLPHEHAHTVAQVVPALALHLDVLADHVEPERCHRLYVETKGLVRGSRHEAVGPVSLIEHAAQEERLVVQAEALHALLVWLDRGGPEGAVAVDVVRIVRELDGVQVRIIRRPGVRRGHVEPELDGVQTVGRDVDRLEGYAPSRCVYHMRGNLAAGLVHGDEQRQKLGVEVSRDLEGPYMEFGDRLDQDRLPDAALRRVPDAAALEVLLAAQLRALVAGVEHADGDLVVAFHERVGDVERERLVPADMLTGLHAIDVDRACVVHGLEMQQVAIVARDVVSVEGAAIPQQLRGLQRLSDPG